MGWTSSVFFFWIYKNSGISRSNYSEFNSCFNLKLICIQSSGCKFSTWPVSTQNAFFFLLLLTPNESKRFINLIEFPFSNKFSFVVSHSFAELKREFDRISIYPDGWNLSFHKRFRIDRKMYIYNHGGPDRLWINMCSYVPFWHTRQYWTCSKCFRRDEPFFLYTYIIHSNTNS